VSLLNEFQVRGGVGVGGGLGERRRRNVTFRDLGAEGGGEVGRSSATEDGLIESAGGRKIN
jgi:hypothetical protein